eukprot:jgi/Mesen1/9757/ME000007S09819
MDMEMGPALLLSPGGLGSKKKKTWASSRAGRKEEEEEEEEEEEGARTAAATAGPGPRPTFHPCLHSSGEDPLSCRSRAPAKSSGGKLWVGGSSRPADSSGMPTGADAGAGAGGQPEGGNRLCSWRTVSVLLVLQTMAVLTTLVTYKGALHSTNTSSSASASTSTSRSGGTRGASLEGLDHWSDARKQPLLLMRKERAAVGGTPSSPGGARRSDISGLLLLQERVGGASTGPGGGPVRPGGAASSSTKGGTGVGQGGGADPAVAERLADGGKPERGDAEEDDLDDPAGAEPLEGRRQRERTGAADEDMDELETEEEQAAEGTGGREGVRAGEARGQGEAEATAAAGGRKSPSGKRLEGNQEAHFAAQEGTAAAAAAAAGEGALGRAGGEAGKSTSSLRGAGAAAAAGGRGGGDGGREARELSRERLQKKLRNALRLARTQGGAREQRLRGAVPEEQGHLARDAAGAKARRRLGREQMQKLRAALGLVNIEEVKERVRQQAEGRVPGLRPGRVVNLSAATGGAPWPPSNALSVRLAERNRLPPMNRERFSAGGAMGAQREGAGEEGDRVVVVLYVHNRPHYLRVVLDALARVDGINETLLIVRCSFMHTCACALAHARARALPRPLFCGCGVPLLSGSGSGSCSCSLAPSHSLSAPCSPPQELLLLVPLLLLLLLLPPPPPPPSSDSPPSCLWSKGAVPSPSGKAAHHPPGSMRG